MEDQQAKLKTLGVISTLTKGTATQPTLLQVNALGIVKKVIEGLHFEGCRGASGRWLSRLVPVVASKGLECDSKMTSGARTVCACLCVYLATWEVGREPGLGLKSIPNLTLRF